MEEYGLDVLAASAEAVVAGLGPLAVQLAGLAGLAVQAGRAVTLDAMEVLVTGQGRDLLRGLVQLALDAQAQREVRLAAAHTGVAMGRAGSDLALDTADAADAVIMRDDLATIPAIITLSRRVITANLVIAAAIIAALAAWDLAGHEGSTVIVGLNGLRLLRGSTWRKALNGGQR